MSLSRTTVPRAVASRAAAWIASGFLFIAPALISPAEAGAYSANANPSPQETCHDLHIAFMAIASANQSALRIGIARNLDTSAMAGCRVNPQASIAKLQRALHVVTPL